MWNLKPAEKVIDLNSDSDYDSGDVPVPDKKAASALVDSSGKLNPVYTCEPRDVLEDMLQQNIAAERDSDVKDVPGLDSVHTCEPKDVLEDMLQQNTAAASDSDVKDVPAKKIKKEPGAGPVGNFKPVKTDNVAQCKKSNSRGKHLYEDKWAPHFGHGDCRGLDRACVMGERGGPAPAGPSGLCDLCNLPEIPLLHHHGQGRLTHLLLQLAPAESALALARIQEVDAVIAQECRQRLKRAHDRKRPDRPRRGPRGPYKKK